MHKVVGVAIGVLAFAQWLGICLVQSDLFSKVGPSEPVSLPVLVNFLVMLALSWVLVVPRLSWNRFLLIIALALSHIVLGEIMGLLNIPLYLDTFGGVAATLLLGKREAAACSLTGSLFAAVVNPPAIPFAAINLGIVWMAGKFAEYGGFFNLLTSTLSGALVGLVTAVLVAPMNIVIFGPLIGTGQTPVDAVANELKSSLLGIVQAYGTSDPVDKAVVFALAYLLVRAVRTRRARSDAPTP